MTLLIKTWSATIGVALASALGSVIFSASPSAAQVNCSRVLNERCSQTYRVDAGNASHTSQGKKEAENEVTVPSGYVVVNFREIDESSQTGGGTFNVSYAARGTISNVVRQYASESSRISDYKAKVDALYQGSQGSEKAKLDILRNQLNALSSAASTSSSVNTNTDVFTLRATSQYQCTRMLFGECLDGRGGHGKGSLIVDLVFVGDNPSAMLNSIGQQIAQLSSASRPSCSPSYDPRAFRPGTSGWTGQIGQIAFVNNRGGRPVRVTLYHPDAPERAFKSWTVQPEQNIFLDDVTVGMDWGIQIDNSAICIVGRVSDWNQFNGRFIFQGSTARMPN